jgi:mannose PTS system EIIA component
MNNQILIIAHAPLAQALKACALHVYPECEEDVIAIDVQPDDSPEKTLELVKKATQNINKQTQTGGLLVLTDIFGATPANVAQRLVAQTQAKLIAGVNLPMLYRSVCYRHETLETMAARAMVGGTQGVLQVTLPAPQTQHHRHNDHKKTDHQQ